MGCADGRLGRDRKQGLKKVSAGGTDRGAPCKSSGPYFVLKASPQKLYCEISFGCVVFMCKCESDCALMNLCRC